MMQEPFYPNPDLASSTGHLANWSQADRRRWGWHNLHRIARYRCAFRAANVMRLEKRARVDIAEHPAVTHLCGLPWFSALVVIRGNSILCERYASDFGPDRPHSIQSITKTLLNLILGQLVDEKALDLNSLVNRYVPELGSGYAGVTVQQVLNMDVVNDYSEDFTNPAAMYYEHEAAMGWRLPRAGKEDATEHSFLRRIGSQDTGNGTGVAQYKDANSAVLGWVAERAGGRPLRSFLADIVDAAGLEHSLHITTDREGVPTVEGGASLTARDLARYFSIFVRRGCGIHGEGVGSSSLIEASVGSGVPMPAPYDGIRYSNHLMVRGRTVGHGGWGGQYVLGNLDTGTVVVLFSVLENEFATNGDYLPGVIAALEEIAEM